MKLCKWVLLPIVWGAIVGCSHDEGTALDRDAFYRPPPGTVEQRHVLQDQPSPSMFDTVRVDLMDPNAQKTLPLPLPLAPDETPPGQSVTSISDVVRESIVSPATAGAGTPSALSAPPATVPLDEPPRPGVSSGMAMLVGGVVCEVNGSPIYADKLISSLSKLLATEAKQRDERSFRALARQEIEKQFGVFINNELEFALAQKNLDPREKQYAEEATARWRQEQITQAGGSLERAKARFAAEGEDFDERVQDQYRTYMVMIYYQKKVFPHAQPRADDMRRYYNQNVKSEFTHPDEAQFRVIKIDIARTGGEPQARDKIGNLLQRVRRGEDFAEIASSVNDDPSLMRSGGDVGWVQRGAYRLEQLEDAVWKLQPGQTTDVLRVGDAFYIAKLENRKLGYVEPFEAEAVQKKIEDTLKKQVIASKRQQQIDALRREAIIYPDPPDLAPVLEMAMQKYAQWASAAR